MTDQENRRWNRDRHPARGCQRFIGIGGGNCTQPLRVQGMCVLDGHGVSCNDEWYSGWYLRVNVNSLFHKLYTFHSHSPKDVVIMVKKIAIIYTEPFSCSQEIIIAERWLHKHFT